MRKDRWLVRSSGRLLGPYTTAEIAELVRTRVLTLHNEVAGPRQQWVSLGEKEEFLALMDNIADELNDSLTSTGLQDSSYTLSVTERISSSEENLTQKSSLDEIVYQDVEEDVDCSKNSHQLSYKSYGAEASLKDQKHAQMTAIKFWVIGVSSLLILAGLVYSYKVSRINQHQALEDNLHMPYDDLVQLARTKLKNGHYLGALNLFKRAYQQKKTDDKNLYIYLGSLMAQLGNEELETKSFLKQAGLSKSATTKKKIYDVTWHRGL